MVALSQIGAAISAIDALPMSDIKAALADPANLGNDLATIEVVAGIVAIFVPAAAVAAEALATLTFLVGLEPFFGAGPEPIRDGQTTDTPHSGRKGYKR